MCDVDNDSDSPSVWNERWQRARKPYRCVCCHTLIAINDRYLYHFSVSDGNAWTDRLCKTCDESREQFAAAHGGLLPCPANFGHALAECIDERDEESLKWKPMLGQIHARMEKAAAEAENQT